MEILDTLTRLENKEDNGTLQKRKARMCIRGDQQVEGESFNAPDLYAPVLKARCTTIGSNCSMPVIKD